ncbi:peptide ABC transporter substrate-binding protein [Anaerolineales bacterium HSG25]|nr:peptide ABC transporter substrate-binding protein [Anaerolineales bacterium HSG25]
MGQHIRWQAIITFTGIALTLAVLTFLAFSRTTVTVSETGGTYIEAVAGRPQFINPLLAQFNQIDQDLVTLIFNGLTKVDETGEIVPDLAKNWEVSEDGLSYLFQLRDDIRWQDGRLFAADDVIFTIELMQSADFPGLPELQELWQMVTVEKVDPYTIRFVLPTALPTFLNFTTVGILPAHHFDEITASELLDHPFNLAPVGTGPFKIDTINTEFARLSASRFYNGLEPRLDSLEFRFYPTPQEVLTAYEQKDVLGGAIPTEAEPIARKIKSLNLYHAPLSGYNLIYFNLQNEEEVPFLQEIEVRQALGYGINRQILIDQAVQGSGISTANPMLPWSWAYNLAQPEPEFDPERAKTLLGRTGWADIDNDGTRERGDVRLAVTLLAPANPVKIAVANEISRQWGELGVEVTVEIVEAQLGERLQQHDYQVALAELSFFGDPDPYTLWHASQIENGQNFAGWDNRRVSTLLEEARIVTDRGHRNDFYFEFQRIFANEVPALILYQPIFTYGVSNQVYDVQLSLMITPGDRFRNIADWYMITERTIEKELQLHEVNE